MARADPPEEMRNVTTASQVLAAATWASEAARRERQLAASVGDSLRRSAAALERSATLAEQLDERRPRAHAGDAAKIQRARNAARRSLALARRVA